MKDRRINDPNKRECRATRYGTRRSGCARRVTRTRRLEGDRREASCLVPYENCRRGDQQRQPMLVRRWTKPDRRKPE